MKKLSYPRENIDDRQENTISLPFVCKMRYIKRVHRILKTNGSGIVFSCLSSMFSRGVTQFFHGGNTIFSLWSLSRFVTKLFISSSSPIIKHCSRHYWVPMMVLNLTRSSDVPRVNSWHSQDFRASHPTSE